MRVYKLICIYIIIISPKFCDRLFLLNQHFNLYKTKKLIFTNTFKNNIIFFIMINTFYWWMVKLEILIDLFVKLLILWRQNLKKKEYIKETNWRYFFQIFFPSNIKIQFFEKSNLIKKIKNFRNLKYLIYSYLIIISGLKQVKFKSNNSVIFLNFRIFIFR